MKTKQKNDYIKVLLMKELTEIDFIQDYFELVFDDVRLSILIKSSVEKNGERIRDNSKFFASELISCINSYVKEVTMIEHETFTIQFSNKVILEISLHLQDYVIPEAVIISSNNQEIFAVL